MAFNYEFGECSYFSHVLRVAANIGFPPVLNPNIEADMNDFTIRKGKPDDMATALELIQELALYEKAPLEVLTTEAILIEDGFGANKIFDIFVAERDENIVGIAIYYEKYSTWKGRCIFLEDIIVTEELRGKGIGKLLFEEVMSVAKEKGVHRMEWQVLDWNEPAIKFYEKYNAVLDGEWLNGKLTFEQLQQSEFKV